ncbi:MAG: 1-acyl-sn-glycerol-3-phosphate acyltransferase [Deltaproteobacteria bacterium]|nr:1-acyl-sn-glycerol-3-phosphate acyltransferase [Deltaproteobacteria bacterium]
MGENAASQALVKVPQTGDAITARGVPDRTTLPVSACAARYLDPIHYDPVDVERIRELSRKGTVVYTHRSANWVDILLLQRQLPKHDLPRAEFVAGFNTRMFHPIWTWFRRDHEPGAPADPVAREEWRLFRTLTEQKSALVFLKHPSTLVNPRPAQQAHYARAIIRAQRESSRPIFLVPQVIIWIHRPGHFRPTLSDVVFGTSDSPGAMRALGIAWLLYRWAKIRVAEAVNVQEFLERFKELSDDALARKLRFLLNFGLGREQHILNGPPLKTHARMREETLRDPRLNKAIAQISQAENRPVAALLDRARKQYDEIASKFDVDAMSVLDWLLRVVWNRIYDGVEVDPADIRKLKETARRGPLVLLPCHRSHVDYLVLGQVLYWNGMMPPLVAAGLNLSFWPLGPMFRRGGAYFIRRTFKGDALYPHMVRTYIKHMLREGFYQEFFIEGGRSRTGKTLPPKLGMLSIVVDAFLEGVQKDVAVIPVHIGYEKIVESRSYARELAGGAKEKESIKGLLSAGSVLRHKYGRVYVTFDEPIMMREFLVDRGLQPEAENEPLRVKAAVRSLGHRVVYGINRSAVVTPTAVAALGLLGHVRRGLPHSVLLGYSQRILEHVLLVSGNNARISPVLQQDLEAALREAMTRLAEERLVEISSANGEVFYRPIDSRRVALDYYKNNIVHFFVPDAIVAASLRSLRPAPGEAVPLDRVKERARLLSRLLKMEFHFRKGPFDALFDEALMRSVNKGYLSVADGCVALGRDPLSDQLARFVANLLTNFLEGYAIAFEHVRALVTHSVAKREVISTVLDRSRASFLAGEMVHGESVNKAVIENVVDLLIDLGVLNTSGEGSQTTVSPGDNFATRMADLVQESHLFLDQSPRD